MTPGNQGSGCGTHTGVQGVRFRARLHEITLETPDLRELAGFYARAMGFSFRSEGEILRGMAKDRRLCLRHGTAKQLATAQYAVSDRTVLDALMHRLALAGVAYTERAGGSLGKAVWILDPDGNHVSFGLVDESLDTGEVFSGLGVRTARLQHLVFASANAPRLVEFYQSIVGFTVSDVVVDDSGVLRAAFLSCSADHHSLAVFAAAHSRLDHFCFEAGDWGLIRDWADHFATRHIALKWGPGRHGPGSNLFFFIHDSDGNWVEISAELEQVEVGRPTGRWPHEQRTLNSWGAAYLRS